MRQPGGDYAFCSENADPIVEQAVAVLGIGRIVYAPDESCHAQQSNYLGVELSPGSPYTADVLCDLLGDIARGVKRDGGRVQRYRSLGSITLARADELNLPDDISPFEPIGEEYAERLGVPLNTVMKSCGRRYYAHGGYYGEIAVPV